jgi:hypothetical protein
VRSSDSASMPSAPPAVDPSATPRRLQSLLIRGEGHDPTPVVAEARGSAPGQAGERVAIA